MHASDANTVGKAKSVLVFGDGDSAVAVTTTLIAQGVAVRRRARPRFVGATLIDDDLQRHTEQVILPVVDAIGDLLKTPKVRFEISASNVGAASGSDARIQIGGFSADVPLFLAMLSARLKIPVPADVASTGHIASPDGDIRWVRHLSAKLNAAANDAGVRVFICPATSEDGSVRSLSPREEARGKAALAAAKDTLRIVETSNVDDLVKRVFRDADILTGALATGFYAFSPRQLPTESTVHRVVSYLGTSNEGRFWRTLEYDLLEMRHDRARETLTSFIGYSIARRSYPERFGQRLRPLLLSLPPRTRRSLSNRPLIAVADCIRLSQFASESDHQDVQILYRVAELTPADQGDVVPTKPAESPSSETDDRVEALLAEIAADNIARKVGLAIDSARAAYVLGSVTAKDHQEFLDGVAAFYLHLLRYLGKVDGTADPEDLGPEALGLLREAFRGEGGEPAARKEALDGVRGGMRYVLDRMTNEYKRKKAQDYVKFAVERGVGSLDWDARTAFMRALFRRLRQDLPSGIAIDTPERFATAVETIAQAWTESMDQLNMIVKSM